MKSQKSFEAQFIIGNTDYQLCPKDDRLEVAFIGRSNVGKSSLINALANSKKIAKTSSTPGKTREINHFLIDSTFYLVDLPGYGFAKMSKTDKGKMQDMIADYILNRDSLIAVFVLLDIRHKAQAIDLEFISWLASNGIPQILVFTKGDKLGKNRKHENLHAYEEVLYQSWEELPSIFVTSSESKEGIPELRNYIRQITKK
jgi:GTP-binding protein